jgi:Putative transposase of IS4/5 family (DUF4096)
VRRTRPFQAKELLNRTYPDYRPQGGPICNPFPSLPKHCRTIGGYQVFGLHCFACGSDYRIATDSAYEGHCPVCGQPARIASATLQGVLLTRTRQVREGVLWILRTGAQWSELPRDKFPPYQTCHRRFQQWACGHAGQGLAPLGQRSSGARPAGPGHLFIRQSPVLLREGVAVLGCTTGLGRPTPFRPHPTVASFVT